MLLDLVEQLVDACLHFGRQRQERPRPSFGELVEPVYQSYQTVHEQYLTNLGEYRAKLNEPGGFSANVEKLCGRLGTDNLLPFTLGAKVTQFMETSRLQLTSYTHSDPLIGFMIDIRSYLSRAFTELCGTQYTGRALRVVSPVFRNSLDRRLRTIGAEATLTEQRKQVVAVQVLDGIVAELQGAFAVVTRGYLTLRAEMPAPGRL